MCATIHPCMTTDFKTLDEWLAYCEQLHPKAIDMGLERVRSVATRMGLGFDQCHGQACKGQPNGGA